MDDVVVGVITLATGAVFCFRGYLAMRIVIPIWGAFAGFLLGAGLLASGDEGFLGTALGWIIGLALAVLFALVAYLYYEVAVVIGMSAIGFAIGASVLVAFGVTWSWVVVLSGVALAIVLAVVAVVGDLPMILLTLLTALAGASAMVNGLMLLFGAVDLDDYTTASTTEVAADDWWWLAIYAVLAIGGVIAQLTDVDRRRATLRDAWTTGISPPSTV